MNIKKKIKNILDFRPKDTSNQMISATELFAKYKDFTMINFDTFKINLMLCKNIKDIEGSIVECGVWRGGMIAGMSEILGKEREYFLFDSFEGLPEAKAIDGEKAINWQKDKEASNYYDNCKAEISYAEEAMKLAGAKHVKLMKGWFKDTLPLYDANNPIALLRLDCDWYESTMDCLEVLFPYIKKGGMLLIDDYFTWDGCSIAVHDYLSKYKLPHRINSVERRIAYIIK